MSCISTPRLQGAPPLQHDVTTSEVKERESDNTTCVVDAAYLGGLIASSGVVTVGFCDFRKNDTFLLIN